MSSCSPTTGGAPSQAPVHMLSPGDAEVIFFSGVIQHLWEGEIHLCPLF